MIIDTGAVQREGFQGAFASPVNHKRVQNQPDIPARYVQYFTASKHFGFHSCHCGARPHADRKKKGEDAVPASGLFKKKTTKKNYTRAPDGPPQKAKGKQLARSCV